MHLLNSKHPYFILGIISFFLFLSLPLISQKESDIFELIQNSQSDSLKSLLYGKLTMSELNNFETALPYAEKSLFYAESSKDHLSIADATFLIGYVYFNNRCLQQCQDFFDRSRESYKDLGQFEKSGLSIYYKGYAQNDLGEISNAIRSFEEGLSIAEATKNDFLTITLLNALGPAYSAAFRFPEARTSIEKSLYMSDSLNISVSSTYNQLALVQKAEGKYSESINSLRISNQHFSKDENYKNLAAYYSNMSEVFLKMAAFDSSLAYITKYQELVQTQRDTFLIAQGEMLLAEFQFNLAEHQTAVRNCERSLELFRYAIDSLQAYDLIVRIQLSENRLNLAKTTLVNLKELTENLCSKSQEVRNTSYEGLIQAKMGNTETAEKLFLESLNKTKNLGDLQYLPDTYYYLATVYKDFEQYQKSMLYVDSALKLSEISSNFQKHSALTKLKSVNYEKMNAPSDALIWLKKHQAHEDSLKRIELLKQLSSLHAQHEIDEKNSENKVLIALREIDQVKIRQKNLIAFSLALILLLLGIISIILIRNNRKKHEQNIRLEFEVLSRTTELNNQNKRLLEIEKAQELQKAKTQFFANISHEFRTPLTLISGTLRQLLGSQITSMGIKNKLNRAQRSSEELLQLVTDLLDVTRLEVSDIQIDPKLVNLSLFFDEIISQFDSLITENDIQFTLDKNQTHDFYTDNKLLTRIINNLISNSIKYNVPGGEVVVEYECLENSLNLLISDTGVGIDNDNLDKIFDRFYQAPQPTNSVKNEFSSTGIGLSICKEYTNKLGGTINVFSPGKLGVGTSFLVELPNLRAEVKPENHAADYLNVPQCKNLILPTHSSIEILIAEDNDDLRSFLKEILEECFNTQSFRNGKELLEYLENQISHPTLIITDLMMPILDGFSLVENLKSSEEYRGIPIIALTARADLKDQLKALRIGVDDYILKPFDENDLKTRIAALINQRYHVNRLVGENVDAVEQKIPLNRLTKEDYQWLAQLEKNAMDLLTDFNYSSEDLAKSLNMSRAKFFRVVKKLTGLTVNQYVKEFRLQAARKLLEDGKVQSVKEVSYAVGFKHINYFSQSFEDRFGNRPSKYISVEM